MDHSEAVNQMAAERYLLRELTPEECAAFEEHVFDCPECALDLRSGAAFVEIAKAQLRDLPALAPPPAKTLNPLKGWSDRFPWLRPAVWTRPANWMRPAFAAPAFAALLLVIGYQNLVTFPALRATVNQPHLLPSVPMYGATRGANSITITADRSHGFAVPFELYRQPDTANYTSYSFDLYDAQGKLAWTGVFAVPGDPNSGDQRLSLAIPGAMLQNGAYTVTVTGIGPHGERTEVERQVFDLHLID